MYLTDYREPSLKDVITQLEPGLFKKVTGLNVNDFELLCNIGVFNASLMNDAIFKFKRYEDASLAYTGIEKHVSDEIGGWDTTIRREEYERLFFNQQASLEGEASTGASEMKSDDIVTAILVNKEEDVSQKPKLGEEKVGSKVLHEKFGEGTIVKIDKYKKYIHVVFEDGEKLFANDAFERGLLILK